MHQGAEPVRPVAGRGMGPDRMPAADAEPTMYGGAAPLPGEPAGEAGEAPPDAAAILAAVYEALEERGYDPVRQLAGYLLSGDPAYITSHRGARALVARVERDQLLTELVRTYVAGLRGRALRHERKA